MKYCTRCGNVMQDNENYCGRCGNCSSNANDTSNVSYNNYVNCYKEDKMSVGMNILSFLIPLVGFIMYYTERKEYPIKAKGCVISATAGWGINMLLILAQYALKTI